MNPKRVVHGNGAAKFRKTPELNRHRVKANSAPFFASAGTVSAGSRGGRSRAGTGTCSDGS